MEVCVLSSGSKGNCMLLKVAGKNILVDCGINMKKLNERLAQLGMDTLDIDAVFITHEHSDHIAGCKVISKNNPHIKFYFNRKTYLACKFCIDEKQLEFFENGTFNFHNITVNALTKNHDAADPVSFSFEFKGNKSAFLTDFGSVCLNIVSQVQDSDILVFEFNHDVGMLMGGSYPPSLKNRILSNVGHLSNIDAVNCLKKHSTKKLKHLFLSHLSGSNNKKDLALKMIEKELEGVNFIMTHEDKITPLIKLSQ